MSSNKSEIISRENKKEIIYNLINAGLAGALVFFGSFVGSNSFNWAGLGAALIAAMIVIITKFKNYWDGEQKEYCKTMFNFI